MKPNDDEAIQDENVASKRKKQKEEREWTKEEMDKAEPCPMPEVPDEDEKK